jgi:glycosyltransferase involved in cell wall biosynthesis
MSALDATDAARTPLLSIVTICYDSARTIADTFASIRAQADPRVEYIVVDGASRDGTVDLIRANADIIDAFVSEPDAGTSDALNKGVRMARGGFLWFLNADDWLEPGALAVVLDRLAAFGLRDDLMLIGSTRYVSQEGALLSLMSCDPASLARMLECNPIPYPSTILSRALFERSGGFGLTYEIVNDYEFWLRVMARRPRVELLDRVLANMREGGQSSSQASVANRARHQFELFRVQRAHTSLPRACRSQVARLVDFVRTRAAGTVR